MASLSLGHLFRSRKGPYEYHSFLDPEPTKYQVRKYIDSAESYKPGFYVSVKKLKEMA